MIWRGDSMLKILDHPTEHMSRVEMHKKYKGYAFIVIDTQDEHDKNGVSLPCSGNPGATG